MSDWKECRLRDVTHGNGTYGIAASAVPKDDNKYTYLRITDINDDGSLNSSDLKSVDNPNADKYLLKPNDIVFARTGNSTGRTYFYDGSAGELVFAGFLIKFSLDSNKVNPKILKYYTHSKEYYDWVASFDSGATRGNINAKTYAEMPIKLPPRNVQDRIVNILSSLDEKIETNRKINARLEELAQALFKSWFIDFEPFGGKMPEDWNFKFISDFPHEIGTGKRPKGGVSGITDGIPSIGAESIKGIGYYDFSKTKYIPYEYAEKLNKGRIQDFDLLIYKDGGKPGYFIPAFSMMGLGFPFKEMILNEHVFRLNFGKPELNIFAYFYFKTDDVMNYLNSVGGKAAIPGINQKNVEHIKILDLDLPKVKEFGSVVLPMFKTILENCKESSRLAALRDTLLPKLMSGELLPE